jgi:raffinose/stachyose/melibiose transport system permease protein
MKRGRLLPMVAKIITMSAISLIVLIPFCLVILNSLKSHAQASSMAFDLPTEVHLENYYTVLVRGKLFETFLNSALYSAGSVVLAVVATAMAAFVLSRNRTKVNRAIYFLVVLGLAMPVNFVSLMKVLQVLHGCLESVSLSALLSQQHGALADDARGLQLLRSVHERLESRMR